MDTNFDVTKGNKDWYGSDVILRNEVTSILRNIFDKYGFESIETPIIESREALAFKGGGEIQKEVFQLQDQGKRELALRFDQTVPLARFIATHKEIKFPFKRQVIGPVFRDGPTQPEQGRYRQFTQCDVDTLGIKEMTAEAELLALAQDAFQALGLGGIEMNINNRKLLDGILEYAGVPEHAKLKSIIMLDKMDKIGIDGVREGLEQLTFSESARGLSNETLARLNYFYDREGPEAALVQTSGIIESEIGSKGLADISDMVRAGGNKSELVGKLSSYQTKGELLLTSENVKKLMNAINPGETNDSTYDRLVSMIRSDRGASGLVEVRQLLDYSKSMGFDFVKLNPSLARGLNYYTGTTIEVFLKNKDIVSSAILAGGRFDDMIGDFRGGEEEIPAVGFSFGLERLVMIVANNRNPKRTNTQLYVVPLGTTDSCLKIVHDLRNSGINVDMNLQPQKKVGKCIEYALEKGIPYVGIVGDRELAQGTIALKTLAEKKQEDVKFGDVASYIQSRGK